MRQHRNTAAVLSILAMGLGQFYNRQYIKGMILLILTVSGIYMAITRLPHAIWGIWTLGESKTELKKVGRLYQQVMGDHSIFLLVEGLITIFILIVLVWIYIANVKDAYRVGKKREEGIQPNRFGETVRYVLDYRFPHLMISVPILGILFFTIMPIVFMILLAFSNFTRENMPPAHLISWHGFQTFKDMFRIQLWSNTFYGVTLWTFIWAFCATFTCFFGGFSIALLVQQQDVRFKSFWRVIYILPYAIPAFVSTLIMRNMFNGQFGPINQYLSILGFSKIPWLTDAIWAKITIILVNFWLGFPISMLMIIGILSTIPKDMYEAADIDGAGAFKKLRWITFPAVMYSMAPIVVLQFAANINNFNIIYLLTNGNPVNADYRFAGDTDILITWLYKLSIDQGQYNFASVIGIFIFIVLAGFAIWNLRNTKAFKEEDVK